MKYNSKIVCAFFTQEGLPEPQLEYRFHMERKWRFDFAWIDSELPMKLNGHLALEVQGGLFVKGAHVRGAQLQKEHEKRNAAAELGWRILYVEPKDLCTLETVNMIKKCLSL